MYTTRQQHVTNRTRPKREKQTFMHLSLLYKLFAPCCCPCICCCLWCYTYETQVVRDCLRSYLEKRNGLGVDLERLQQAKPTSSPFHRLTFQTDRGNFLSNPIGPDVGMNAMYLPSLPKGNITGIQTIKYPLADASENGGNCRIICMKNVIHKE